MEHNKLVRDKIPEIIEAQGRKALTSVMSEEEYVVHLERKLDEEVGEYHESKEIEELADILEVVYALCEAQGCSIEDLMKTFEKKHNERGGFSKRIFLMKTE